LLNLNASLEDTGRYLHSDGREKVARRIIALLAHAAGGATADCSCALLNRRARWSELGAILTSLVIPIYPPIGQIGTRPTDAMRPRARAQSRPVAAAGRATFGHDAIANDRSPRVLWRPLSFPLLLPMLHPSPTRNNRAIQRTLHCFYAIQLL